MVVQCHVCEILQTFPSKLSQKLQYKAKSEIESRGTRLVTPIVLLCMMQLLVLCMRAVHVCCYYACAMS